MRIICPNCFAHHTISDDLHGKPQGQLRCYQCHQMIDLSRVERGNEGSETNAVKKGRNENSVLFSLHDFQNQQQSSNQSSKERQEGSALIDIRKLAAQALSASSGKNIQETEQPVYPPLPAPSVLLLPSSPKSKFPKWAAVLLSGGGVTVCVLLALFLIKQFSQKETPYVAPQARVSGEIAKTVVSAPPPKVSPSAPVGGGTAPSVPAGLVPKELLGAENNNLVTPPADHASVPSTPDAGHPEAAPTKNELSANKGVVQEGSIGTAQATEKAVGNQVALNQISEKGKLPETKGETKTEAPLVPPPVVTAPPVVSPTDKIAAKSSETASTKPVPDRKPEIAKRPPTIQKPTEKLAIKTQPKIDLPEKQPTPVPVTDKPKVVVKTESPASPIIQPKPPIEKPVEKPKVAEKPKSQKDDLDALLDQATGKDAERPKKSTEEELPEASEVQGNIRSVLSGINKEAFSQCMDKTNPERIRSTHSISVRIDSSGKARASGAGDTETQCVIRLIQGSSRFPKIRNPFTVSFPFIF